MDYRREIDGLRALAVTSVVLYHFWPHVFKYGYLGVDVFFVISGFLITTYLYEAISLKTLSLKIFYQRRVRRILPVTLAVLCVTLTAASFILIGVDYDRFLQSLIASLTFTSNVYFWRDGGYFGQADSLKPLLHIWSLSVEEQFYLFFPILLSLILRSSGSIRSQLIWLTALSFASLGAYLYMAHIGGANPAFFLTPFRAWEFGSGAIAAVVYSQYRTQHTSASMLLSLTLITLGLSALSRWVTPGLLVVIGSALFLSRGYRGNVALNLFFQSKVVRYLGLISFSTYLWHWPLVVYVGYISVDPPEATHLVIALAVTYALSALSYAYVEQPFRHQVRPRWVVLGSLGLTLALLFAAILILEGETGKHKESWAERIAASIQTNYRCNLSEYRAYGASRACLLNSKAARPYSMALVGNSHAQMYAPALAPHLRAADEGALLVPLNGCLPTVQLNLSAKCIQLAQANLDAILNDQSVTTVVLGMTWYSDRLVSASSEVMSDADHSRLLSAVEDLISRLEGHKERVFLIAPLQIPGYDLPSVLSRKVKFKGLTGGALEHHLKVSRGEFDGRFGGLMRALEARLGARLIAPSDVFCDAVSCYFGDDGGVYFADGGHLGSYGAQKLEGLFGVVWSR